MLFSSPQKAMQTVAKQINDVKTLLSYLSYTELMEMPVPLVMSLAKEREKAMKANPAVAGVTQLANVLTGK